MIGLSLTPKDLEFLHQAPKHTDKTLYMGLPQKTEKIVR